MTTAARGLIEPLDEHNRRLVDNVHPPDWTNPEPAGTYNLVVVGAGTAGLVTAIGAAGLGARTALIERHLMGGDCLNVGCVPSKAIISSARVAAAARNAGEYGVTIAGEIHIDFPAVMERMRRLRSRISAMDSAQRVQAAGAGVFLGDARFTGPDTIELAGKTLQFKKAVIATGARASTVPIEGLEEAGFLTNDTLFELTARPDRFAIIGAGPIGCEMAQTFQRLGCQVTLIEMADEIMGREHSGAAAIIRKQLEKEGVVILTGARTKRVAVEEGERRLYLEHDGVERTVEADQILLGVGRAPNVDGLGLEAAGVAYDTRKGVEVNGFLQTTNPNIYAAGDCCMDWKFTHAAEFAARIVIQNTLFSIGRIGRKRLNSLTMSWCTYTDPEVAHIGDYAEDARTKGIEADVWRHEMADNDRAILEGRTNGFVEVVVKRGSDKILGATIVGSNAGDMIGEVSAAIAAGAGLKTIASAIHPYPTQADAIRQTANAYNRGRVTESMSRWLRRWMALRR